MASNKDNDQPAEQEPQYPKPLMLKDILRDPDDAAPATVKAVTAILGPPLSGVMTGVGTNYDLSGVLAGGTIGSVPIVNTAAQAGLQRDLDTLRAQFARLQKDLAEVQADSTQRAQVASLETQVHQLTQTIEQVQTHGAELTAPIVLPPRDDIKLRLVPVHLLRDLEEYRSDEGEYMLFVGVFGGAVASTLVTWFTSEQFTVTRPSQVLFAVLVILTLSCAYRIVRLKRRANRVRAQMLHNNPQERPAKQN